MRVLKGFLLNTQKSVEAVRRPYLPEKAETTKHNKETYETDIMINVRAYALQYTPPARGDRW